MMMGTFAFAPQRLRNLEAVHPREAEVEDDQVRPLRAPRAPARRRPLDR